MENKGILNPDSELDLFCLHLVFLPIIQQHLDDFSFAWNHHGIRTTPGSSSPIRLFIRGLAALRRLSERQNQAFTELDQVRWPHQVKPFFSMK